MKSRAGKELGYRGDRGRYPDPTGPDPKPLSLKQMAENDKKAQELAAFLEKEAAQGRFYELGPDCRIGRRRHAG